MCFIASILPGYSADIVKCSFDDIEWMNDDGVGIIASNNQFLTIRREMKRTKGMDKLLDDESVLRIIHWRYGTSGSESVEHVHPMKCGKTDLWLMQNGITAHWGDAKHSDTWHLANDLIGPLRMAGRSIDACVNMLKRIDPISRFVLYSQKTRKAQYSGNWVKHNEGIYFSTHLPTAWKPIVSSCSVADKSKTSICLMTYGSGDNQKEVFPVIDGYGKSTQYQLAKRRRWREHFDHIKYD